MSRKHSKFSASGFERIAQCPGSVDLSEGMPDKSSPKALEGTQAHAALEAILLSMITEGLDEGLDLGFSPEMISLGTDAAEFIQNIWRKHKWSEILVESKIHLKFIHPEMFGTFDGAVIDHFGTLHVFDYKYGLSMVSPTKNYQMIFYAMGLAHRYQWNFSRVRMWIIQPRARGYDGPTFWEITIPELKAFIPEFKEVVRRAIEDPKVYNEGSWCYFCKGKSKCPLKSESRGETMFGKVDENGKEEKSEADWKKAKKRKGKNSGKALRESAAIGEFY